MFHNIMVAYDESPEAARALTAALELTKALDAQLHIVSVVEPPPVYYSFTVAAVASPLEEWSSEKQARYAALQTEARRQAERIGVVLSTELVNGEEVSSIIACAIRHESDLLVLGLHKHRSLMGTTAHDVVDRAPCAFLGVR